MRVSSLLFIAGLLTPLGVQAADDARVIQADLSQVKGPRSMVWQDCVGAGRVAEGLRDHMTTEPSAQLGVICSNDVRLYQARVQS